MNVLLDNAIQDIAVGDLVAGRVSYIMELRRHIDSIDFTVPVINALLSKNVLPVRDESVTNGYSNVNEHARILTNNLRARHRERGYNYFDLNPTLEEKYQDSVADFLKFAACLVGVQPLPAPVGVIYTLKEATLTAHTVEVGGDKLCLYNCAGWECDDIQDDFEFVTNKMKRDFLKGILNSAEIIRADVYGRSVEYYINEASNRIAEQSRRSRANIMVVSPSFANSNGLYVDESQESAALINVGTFGSGGIEVYASKHMPSDSILVAYKNQHNQVDCGTVYCPYIAFDYNGDKATTRGHLRSVDAKAYYKLIKLGN